MVDTHPIPYDEYGGTVEDGALGRVAAASLGQEKWALLANHGVLLIATYHQLTGVAGQHRKQSLVYKVFGNR